MKKPVAVIILNWNGESLLKRFLPSVVSNTPSDIADVIITDNGSTDGSLAWLRSEYPDLKVLAFDQNLGFAAGYNRAIQETRYPYTLLLNSDVMTPEGWLRPLYEWALSHPDMGAAMPKIRSVADPEFFEYAGASGGFIDRNGYPFCRGRIFSTLEKDRGQYDDPCEVFWATGAAMLVDTEAYLE
ncbi:MAG: glycosyltransferase, partial [Muribaculaceae bacterium]|nr:glycosyltransferase [Muribaculaceae bacterium]